MRRRRERDYIGEPQIPDHTPADKLTGMTIGPDITTGAFLRPSDGQESVECRSVGDATFKKESEIERKSANPIM